MDRWQGCLICMGYIYFDHRVSWDPSVKPICIFVKKYISPLGKKYEKVWKYLKRRWTTEPGMCIITIHRKRRGWKEEKEEEKGEEKEEEEKRVKCWKLMNWRRLAPCLCSSQFTGEDGVKTRPLSLGNFGLWDKTLPHPVCLLYLLGIKIKEEFVFLVFLMFSHQTEVWCIWTQPSPLCLCKSSGSTTAPHPLSFSISEQSKLDLQ